MSDEVRAWGLLSMFTYLEGEERTCFRRILADHSKTQEAVKNAVVVSGRFIVQCVHFSQPCVHLFISSGIRELSWFFC